MKRQIFYYLFAFNIFLGTSTMQKAEASYFQETKIKETGLEIISMPSSKVPIATIVLVMRAGAMTETKDLNGLTHVWEHMFFKGNAKVPDQEAFLRRVRELGITFNGTTSAETVKYFITLPSVFFEEGLQFIADAIATPKLDKGELAKEKIVVLDEFDRNASQPGFKLHEAISNIMYGPHAYRRDPLGARKIIENTTQKQLHRIRDEVFVPQNSAIIVSGDVPELKKLTAMVEKAFKQWKAPKKWSLPERPEMKFLPKGPVQLINVDPQAINSSIRIILPGPRVGDSPEDTFSLDVLSYLLSHRGSKFYKKFVDSGRTLSSSVSYHTQSQVGELYIYATTTKPEDLMSLEKDLKASFEDWSKKDYFDKEHLEDVKRSILLDHENSLESPSQHVMNLTFFWSITGMDYYKKYRESLNAVSLEDIAKVVKKYFDPKIGVTGILIGPDAAKKAKLKDNVDQFLKDEA